MSQGGRNKEEDGPVVTLEEIRGAPDPPLQASWTFLLHDEPLEPGLNRGGRPDPLIPAAYDILAADVFTKLSKIDRAPVGSSTQTAKSGVALPTSVVCAVHGAWGAGKTSFIKVLRRKFIDSKATTLWFEPWRYENERNLVVPLLVEFSTAITQTLRTPASKKSAIDLSKKLVGRVARDIFRTGGKLFERHVGVDPYEIGEEFLKLYAENTLDWSHLQSEVVGFQQDLAEMVALATAKRKGANRAEDPQPIVIFIDDLDRCQHDQVRRLLESIKLLFQTRGVIFVFAIDREQVLRALSAPYQALFREERREDEGQRLANRYLEKFFQITIDLSDGFAPLRRNTRLLRDQVWHLLVGAVTSASGAGDRPRPEIADWELRDLWKLSTIFQSVKGNPRAIKGVARQLYFSYPLHVDGVTPEEQEDIDRNRQQSIRRLIPDFAEEALQMNFGFVWVNELQAVTPEARRNLYRALDALFSDTIAPDIDPESVVPWDDVGRVTEANSRHFASVVYLLRDDVLRAEGLGDRVLDNAAFEVPTKEEADREEGYEEDDAGDNDLLPSQEPAPSGSAEPDFSTGLRAQQLLERSMYDRLLQYRNLVYELHKLLRRGEWSALTSLRVIMHYAKDKELDEQYDEA